MRNTVLGSKSVILSSPDSETTSIPLVDQELAKASSADKIPAESIFQVCDLASASPITSFIRLRICSVISGKKFAGLRRSFTFAILGLLMLAFPAQWAGAREIPFSEGNTVDGAFDGASSVYAADIDGDGDLDVLGAAGDTDEITWWENTNGDGTAWAEHTVDGDFAGATSVYAADVDGDGDLDILAAAYDANDITWWENTNDIGTSWTEHTVGENFNGAYSVYAADLDGDGDLDVLGAASIDDDITWWENTNVAGTAWTEHNVDASFNGAHSVYAADVDADGDMDVLGAAYNDDDITWWENTNDIGTSWTEHIVDANFDGANSVYAVDVDGDGDLDVLGAASIDDDITWWENTNDVGTSWTEHTVEGDFLSANSVYGADMDGDGDMDIVGAAYDANDITWWENADGAGTVWTEHTVEGDFDGAWAMYVADLDGDADLDILGAASIADDISWWENKGGQFKLPTTDSAPATITDGEMDDVLKIITTHSGRTDDTDMELATLDLLFEESAGDPLTSAEANAIINNLHIYLDDGSGTFESGSDTLTTTVSTLVLNNGVQTAAFSDGDPNVQVAYGTPRTYFVVAELASNAASQTPNQFRITHITESSSTAEDRDHDIDLIMEYAANILSSIVTAAPVPTPTPTPTPTPSPSPSPTPTPTPTATPTPTPTPTATPTPTPTPPPTSTVVRTFPMPDSPATKQLFLSGRLLSI